jgi:hypothetical protein
VISKETVVKKNLIVIAALALTLATVPAAFAAGNTDSANFNIHADLLRPIDITKLDDLDFGRIIKSFGAFGTVVVNPMTGAITTSDPVGLMPLGGHQRARFLVLCETSFNYTVTLPTTVQINKIGVASPTAQQTLAVDNFRGWFPGDAAPFTTGFVRACDVDAGTGPGNDGQDIIWLGATLNIANDSETGHYSGASAVTVTYQ